MTGIPFYGILFSVQSDGRTARIYSARRNPPGKPRELYVRTTGHRRRHGRSPARATPQVLAALWQSWRALSTPGAPCRRNHAKGGVLVSCPALINWDACYGRVGSTPFGLRGLSYEWRGVLNSNASEMGYFFFMRFSLFTRYFSSGTSSSFIFIQISLLGGRSKAPKWSNLVEKHW